MRNRAIRPVAAILSVLLLTALPAQAGPIPFGDVTQVFGGLQGGSQTQELRLRSISQSGSTPVSGDTASAQSSTQQQGGTQSAPSSLISTAAGPQQGGQHREADDCGASEIGGAASVFHDVAAGAKVVGSPAIPFREYARRDVLLRRLLKKRQ